MANEQNIESLIYKYVKNEASMEERKDIEEWLKLNSDNEELLKDILQIVYADKLSLAAVQRRHRDTLNSLQVTEKKIKKQVRSNLPRHYYWLRVVASVIFIISISVVIILHNRTNNLSGISKTRLVTVKTNVGTQDHFELPDGTRVHLNSSSAITYNDPFITNGVRMVRLEGEGYFDVSEDAKHPFIVSVYNDTFQITALGTEFNVESYTEEKTIKTTLVEGRVEVATNIEQNNALQVILTPSQQANFAKETGSMIVEKIEAREYTSWIEGKFVFENTPMPELIQKLSRYYNVSFEIETPSINEYSFTGTFENRSLLHILEYLKISSNIEYLFTLSNEEDTTQLRSVVVLK